VLAAGPGPEEDDLLRLNRLSNPLDDRLDEFFVFHGAIIA
jgi:hypothetical protein